MADSTIQIDAMDTILELKNKLLASAGIRGLSISCQLTDLLIAAANAGRVEAYNEINLSREFDQKELQKKIEKLQETIPTEAE